MICDKWLHIYGNKLGTGVKCEWVADVRENVRGEWIAVVDKTEMYDKEGVKTWGMLFQCNQCGFVLNAIEGHTGQYNYCPECGADMRQTTALSKNAEIDSNLKKR